MCAGYCCTMAAMSGQHVATGCAAACCCGTGTHTRLGAGLLLFQQRPGTTGGDLPLAGDDLFLLRRRGDQLAANWSTSGATKWLGRPPTAGSGRRSSTISRPARSARSRWPLRPERHLRRQRRRSAAARSFDRRRHLQIHRRRQDLDAPRPARRPADPADRRRPARSRTGCSSRCSAIPTARTRSAASFARPTAAAPSRRSSTRTRTPARSTSRSIPRIRTPSTPCCGRRGRARGRTARSAARAAACSNRPTAARPGSRSTKGLPTVGADGLGRIGIAIAPSNPKRLFATVDATQPRRALPVRRRAAKTGRASTHDRASRRAASDFAEVKVDPKNPDIVYVASIVTWKSTDGGKTFTGIARRAGRRRLSPHLDQSEQPGHHPARRRSGRDHHGQRRRDLEFLVQPADRAVLSRHHRQRVSRTGCAAASRRAARRASRAAATTGRSRFATGIRSASRSTATSRPIRSTPTSSTAARSRASIGGPGRCRTSRPPRRRRTTASCAPRRCCSRRSTRTSCTSRRTCCGRRRPAASSWTQISPDLTRETWDVPASVGDIPRHAERPRPRSAASSTRSRPSYIDINRIWAGTDDGLIHVTRDGGKTWNDVTPPELTPWSKVSIIDAGALRRADRLRGGQYAPPRRSAAAHLSHARRRQDVDGDRQRHARRRAGQRRCAKIR